MYVLVRRTLEQSTARTRAFLVRSRSVALLALLIPFCLIVVVYQYSTQDTSNKFARGDYEDFNSIVWNDSSFLTLSDAFVYANVDSLETCTCKKEQAPKTKSSPLTTVQNSFTTERSATTKKLYNELPIVFLITPTYTRPTQMPDLTRMAQTLMLVRNVFWIVVEDATTFSRPVRQLLERSNIPFAHLLGPRPATHRDARSGRGVSNRLRALKYLRDKFGLGGQRWPAMPGVIYFADDDNAYDVRLFDELRKTRKVSVFPVGGIDGLGLSTPVLNMETKKVIGFHDPFIKQRYFALDMAGFAVNLQFFLSKPKATMPYKVGYEEDFFLRSLEITLEDLEPLANGCTEILVWHTRTKAVVAPKTSDIKQEWKSSNLQSLYKNILEVDL